MPYTPKPLPEARSEEVKDLGRYVEQELQALSRSFGGQDYIQLVSKHVELERPRDGLIVLADGSDWDPGAGEGIYAYFDGAWQFLGSAVLDATLTALAAYNTDGLLTQTAADTFTGRTITGTANEVAVANGSGVAGNPTLSLPADIDLSGKTSLKVPTGTGPTVDASGKVAIDTNTDNSVITHGSMIFHDGSALRYIPSVSTLPSSDGDVLKYNGTSKRFEFGAAPAGTAADQADMEAATETDEYVSPIMQKHNPAHAKAYGVWYYEVAAVTGNISAVDTGTEVITWSTNHLLSTGDVIYSTGGTWPTGPTATAAYFTRALSATTFALYATLADAQADTNRIDLTAAGSGTRTMSKITTTVLEDFGLDGTTPILPRGGDTSERFDLLLATALSTANTGIGFAKTVSATPGNTNNIIPSSTTLFSVDSGQPWGTATGLTTRGYMLIWGDH